MANIPDEGLLIEVHATDVALVIAFVFMSNVPLETPADEIYGVVHVGAVVEPVDAKN
jgi:hypothetical protein